MERLLGTQMRHLFQDEGDGHLARRMTAAERRVGELILRELAEAGRPLARLGLVATAMDRGADKALVHRVLLQLVDDFYLVERGDDLAFLVPLFGRWWRRWGA